MFDRLTLVLWWWWWWCVLFVCCLVCVCWCVATRRVVQFTTRSKTVKPGARERNYRNLSGCTRFWGRPRMRAHQGDHSRAPKPGACWTLRFLANGVEDSPLIKTVLPLAVVRRLFVVHVGEPSDTAQRKTGCQIELALGRELPGHVMVAWRELTCSCKLAQRRQRAAAESCDGSWDAARCARIANACSSMRVS